MRPKKENKIVLAGDIGGTKIDLGLFTMGKTRPRSKVIKSYSSKKASNLVGVIKHFLDDHPGSIAGACFGVAGPVINGRCKVTNIQWDISEDQIRRSFKWKYVRLINDIEAFGIAVPYLNSRELFPLNKVRLKKNQDIAILAPGTGLGEAIMIYRDERYNLVRSEGGHVDFSPSNENEIELWRYLRNKYGHVSNERVVSGEGLTNIYEWRKAARMYNEPIWLTKMLKLNNPARVISGAALSSSDPICEEALRIFVSILGAVAGNLALTGLTFGGVFLGGGIPIKILPILQQDIFMKSFLNKGRFRSLLEKIPVRVILSNKAALLGASHTAFQSILTLGDP